MGTTMVTGSHQDPASKHLSNRPLGARGPRFASLPVGVSGAPLAATAYSDGQHAAQTAKQMEHGGLEQEHEHLDQHGNDDLFHALLLTLGGELRAAIS
jgi:hypothetical protein